MDYEEANRLATQLIGNYARTVNRISVPEPIFKQLYEVAEAMAAFGRDGFLFQDINDTMECPFCDASYFVGNVLNENTDHKPDCAYLKAQGLIEHKEGDTHQ